MPIGSPTYYPASPVAIRDGTWQRVQTIQAFAGNVFRARLMPTKDMLLPYAMVHLVGERTEPWGDANTAEPSLDHTLTLGVEIVMASPAANAAGNAATAPDADIVALVETVKATLMTDPTWVNLFEGLERANVRYAYPTESTELQVSALIEFDLTFRSSWEPYVPNDLTEIATTVQMPSVPFIDGAVQTIDFQDQSP